MSVDAFKFFVRNQKWRWAKTYADSAPHYYIVKDKLEEPWQSQFSSMVTAIREYGFDAMFYSSTNRYLIVDDWYYWTMGAPVNETDIINKARLFDYVLWRKCWYYRKSHGLKRALLSDLGYT